MVNLFSLTPKAVLVQDFRVGHEKQNKYNSWYFVGAAINQRYGDGTNPMLRGAEL